MKELLPDEIFKPVTGWEIELEVSNLGRVYSLLTNKFVTQNDNGKGYKKIRVRRKGETYWNHLRVHRLVAIAFIPNPHNLDIVNHKDLNKANNHVLNLEWLTHEDNIKHYFKTR